MLVLGHERCGVITAAVGLAREPREVQGHLWSLLDAVRPAVDVAPDTGEAEDVVDEAVRAHVGIQADRLRRAQPIVARAARSGAIQVVGARYDIDRGQVELLT